MFILRLITSILFGLSALGQMYFVFKFGTDWIFDLVLGGVFAFLSAFQGIEAFRLRNK
jgi:hypothetical protein